MSVPPELEVAVAIGDFDGLDVATRESLAQDAGPTSTALRLRAQLELERLNPKKALGILAQAVARARDEADGEQIIHGLGQLATVAAEVSDHAVSREAMSALLSLPPSDDQAESLRNLYRGTYSLARRELDEASMVLDQASAQASSCGRYDLQARCQRARFDIFGRRHDPDSQAAAAQRVLELSVNLSWPAMRDALLLVFNLRMTFGVDAELARTTLQQGVATIAGPLTPTERARFLGTTGARLVEQRWNGSGLPMLKEAITQSSALKLEVEELLWLVAAGDAHNWIGDIESGMPYLARAVLAMPPAMPRTRAAALLAMSDDHCRSGAFEDAARCLNQAATIGRALDDGYLLFRWLLQAARLSIATGNAADADRYSAEALALAQSRAPERLRIPAVLGRAEYLLASGDSAPALEFLSDAYILALRNCSFYDVLQATRHLASVALELELQEEAHRMYLRLAELCETARADYPHVDDRLRIQERVRAVLEPGVALCVQLGANEERFREDAFRLAQLFHNRVVHETAEARTDVDVDSERLVGFPHIQTRHRTIRGTRVSEVLPRARNVFAHSVPPRSAQSLDSLRSHLREEDLFVECVGIGSNYVLMPLDSLNLYPPIITAREALDREVDRFYGLVEAANAADGPEATSTIDESLAILGQMTGIAYLPEKSEARRLIVAPDAALSRLPFCALPAGTSRSTLLDHFVDGIELWPSASHFVAAPPRQPIKTALLIRGDRGDLPDAAREVDRIKRLEGVAIRYRSGEEATLSALVAESGDIDLLYFIGHGRLLDDNDFMSSQLELWDEPLAAIDLFRGRIRFRAGATVLLSACTVGRSGVAEGAELSGFVRGLLYSGASAVAAPLWPIDDEVAAEVMATLCGRLLEGDDICVAGRHALLHARQREYGDLGDISTQPAVWAGLQWWGR